MKRFAGLMTALATVLMASASAHAAERNGLGLYVSNFAGSGLTYTYVSKAGWGAHISSFVWAQNPQTGMSYGGALTRELVQIEDVSTYSLLGVGFDWSPSAAAMSRVNIAPGLGMRFGPFFVEASVALFADQNSGPLIGGVRQPLGFGAGGSFWW